MTAATWSRIGLVLASVSMALSTWGAAIESRPGWLAFHVGMGLAQAFLFVSLLRDLLRHRRRLELIALRRRLALRGLAYSWVWVDRADPCNPRHPLAGVAMVGTYRALDEMNSARAAMGEPASEAA